MLGNHAPLIVAEQFGTLEFDPLCRSIASTGTPKETATLRPGDGAPS